MTLRSHLYLLALWALSPMVLLAAVIGYALVSDQRETTRQEATGRVRSMMTAVDAAVEGELSTLRALATSASLGSGDLRAFHEESRRVMAGHPSWLNIGLASTAGESLTQAALPYGAKLPPVSDLPSLKRVIATRTAVIGDVAPVPALGGTLAVRLRVPVIYRGEVRYVLSAALKLQVLSDLLSAQGLRKEWIVGLIDHERTFIARIPAAPEGSIASASFRAAIDRAPEGWFHGQSIEGHDIYTSYISSALTGWTLGTAMPASVLDSAAWRTVYGLLAGTGVALIIAAWLAWFFGRRIERPISALASVATDMRRGRAIEVPKSSNITQITALGEALEAASGAIREREALLTKQEAALREADRAKDEFLATLSHELRNPLTPMANALHLMQLGGHDAAVVGKASGMMRRQLRHLVHLVDDLLDISRITRGKLELRRARVALGELVSQAVEASRPVVETGQHALDVKLPNEPLHADADPVRIVQALINLLNNAASYTDRGGRISIELRREGPQVAIIVRDSGIGIESALLPRVFELFTRGDHSPERSQGGLGIGLALARRIAELHGGTLEAASEGPGRGSEFRLVLPLCDPGPLMATDENQLLISISGKRILIVDDNRDAADSLAQLLRMAGNAVTVAYDGAEAVEAARGHAPEAILLDIGLPKMNGYDVCRAIRAQSGGEAIRIIALSGWGQEADRKKSAEAGFDVHLVKPVEMADIERALGGAAVTRA